MQKIFTFILLLLFISCSSTERNKPVFYDPPGSTDTRDKEIRYQIRKTYTFSEEGIAFSNEFSGARLNDVTKLSQNHFLLTFEPENAPVNNSAWFSFQVWSEKATEIELTLQYRDGKHRYVPKLSSDGKNWQPISTQFFRKDSSNGTAKLKLYIGPQKLWVSAQELIPSQDMVKWIENLSQFEYVTNRKIGESVNGRGIIALKIMENPNTDRHILIVGRQHPPEITGAIALMAFVERLTESDSLCENFRRKYSVSAIPLLNPDGVDEGHWRHNAHGIDLNRDWMNFHQKETQIARDYFLEQTKSGIEKVYFSLDFHSTQHDVFYTLDAEHPTQPPLLTEKWLEELQRRLAEGEYDIQPFALESPVSKTWFYNTFQCPSVTYEFGDENDREFIRRKARISAEVLMELLLDY
ncbi:MAG: peptidase M14 [Deferribacteres bacterium]|nr:peptidase M14 [candidate division KSB1 bacterium]MCB9502562.1 peptidase M14 [Deferribacteres bacterium]